MTPDVRSLLQHAAETAAADFDGARDAMRRGVRLRWWRRAQIPVPIVLALALVVTLGGENLPGRDAQRISPAERGDRAPSMPEPKTTGDEGKSGSSGAPRKDVTPGTTKQDPASRSVASLGLNGRLAFTAMEEPAARHECVDSPCLQHSPSDIKVMELAGGRVVSITSSPLFEQESSWSRDGSRLAYSVARGDSTAELHTMRADGSDSRRIVSEEGSSARKPTWSPGGRRIAFVLEPSVPTSAVPGNKNAIWIVDDDGANMRRVDEIDTDTYTTSPAWSPDGRFLAFVQIDSGGSHVHVLDFETQAVTWVGSGNIPAWSPDGTRLAVDTGETVDVIDVTSRRVIDSIGRPGRRFGEPTWSPDGEWIAFAASDAGSSSSGKRSIWVARPNGDDLAVLVDGPQEYWAPSWGIA